MANQDTENEFMFGKDRWADVDDLIRRWARRFPEEYKQNMQWVKEAKEDYTQEKYQDRPFRKGIVIHPRLLVYIQKFYPNMFDSNKDVREFSARFKKFVIDTGIMPTQK